MYNRRTLAFSNAKDAFEFADIYVDRLVTPKCRYRPERDLKHVDLFPCCPLILYYLPGFKGWIEFWACSLFFPYQIHFYIENDLWRTIKRSGLIKRHRPKGGRSGQFQYFDPDSRPSQLLAFEAWD